MIEGRVIIPRDVFVTLCVEHRTLSDHLLQAAKALAKVVDHIPPNSDCLDLLVTANAQLGLIESILKAVIDEFPLPDYPTGGSGSGSSGGESCNAQ